MIMDGQGHDFENFRHLILSPLLFGETYVEKETEKHLVPNKNTNNETAQKII